MKRVILGFAALVLMLNLTKAQDVTNEQVWKYALMTEVIDQMKSELSTAVNDFIKMQDGMTGQRYKELAGGEEPANDFEQQFLDAVNKIKSDRIDAIKSVNSDLATKMLGSAKDYKAVKTAVKADLKAQYEAYRKQIAFQ